MALPIDDVTARESIWRDAARQGGVAILLMGLVVAVLRLQLMLASAHQGIDFTDEGYYLVWIANPSAYAESVTQFGFIYHPLFEWLGRDVSSLRQANILITAFLAWVFVVVFFRSALADDWPALSWRSWPMLVLAAIFATAYPNLLNVWLPTPGYNSLALQALLVCATGLFLMERRVSLACLVGAVLLGVGGWLAFMAKPSTGGAIAFVAFIYLWAAGKLKLAPLMLAALTSSMLLGASAWWIDGSLPAFADRLSGAVELSRLMGVEQPLWRLFRIDGFSLRGLDVPIFLLLVVGVVYAVGVNPWHAQARHGRIMPTLLLAGLVVSSALIVTGHVLPMVDAGRYQGMLAIAPSLGAAIAAVLMWRTHWEGKFSRKHLSMAGLLVVLPHVYAFGTGNNYWQAGQSASIFWVISGMTFLVVAVPSQVTWRVFLPVAVASQWVAVMLLQVALEHPYRQPEPLAMAHSPVEIGGSGAKLLLSADYARYVAAIEQLAVDAGFRPGTPVIDLTGHSPGTLFALGARSTGQAWLLGGYAGSDRYGRHVLGRVSCDEISQAWILTEVNGPRKLGPAVLGDTGLDLARDFDVVGGVRSPDGFGDYKVGSEQKLLRPARPAAQARAACERVRVGAK